MICVAQTFRVANIFAEMADATFEVTRSAPCDLDGALAVDPVVAEFTGPLNTFRSDRHYFLTFLLVVFGAGDYRHEVESGDLHGSPGGDDEHDGGDYFPAVDAFPDG